MRIGIIGGTGFAAHVADAEAVDIETPYGDVVVHHKDELFFLNRHGATVAPPHRIAHRANIEALARCKVDAVLAVNAVGALSPEVRVPSLLVPDDYVDLRKSSETFFEARAVHVDVTEPYCPHLRALLVRHARATDGGVYVATEGPRLETRAEVRMARAMGGSVVGMTGCPEAALARERALCYASLCMVVNLAAGVHDAPLTAADIKRGAEELAPAALAAVLAAAKDLDGRRGCRCRTALDGARL